MRNRILVAAVLLLAAWLRLTGLDWDRGHGFHPDERDLVEAALRLGDGADPGFYADNGLPLHAVRAAARGAAAIRGEPDEPDGVAFSTFCARVISALASLAAVAVAWRLGCAAGGAGFGLLFAALLAFAAGLVQAAHFGTSASLLVLWQLATALAAARLVQDPSRWLRPALASGLFAGLAAGTTTIGATFLLIPAIAVALGFRARGAAGSLAALGVVIAVAAGVFAAVSPHSLQHADAWLQALRAEYAIATGAAPPGLYTLQFRGAPPLRFEISNLHWLAGPLIPVLGAGGMVWLLATARRHARWRPALPLVGFGAAYGIYIATLDAKFARYQLPLLPALLFGAAWALVAVHERRPRLAKIAGAAVVATSLLWALAVAAIYGTPDPRLVASAWLLKSAPPGSIVLNERRDVALPVSDDASPNLTLRSIDSLAPESDAKLATTAQELAAAQYLVLASGRVDEAVRAHPELFPDTSALHRALLAGRLGWEPVARFKSLPHVGPVRMRDDAVEETIRVFDHPTVVIFQNKGHLTAADLVAAIRTPQ